MSWRFGFQLPSSRVASALSLTDVLAPRTACRVGSRSRRRRAPSPCGRAGGPPQRAGGNVRYIIAAPAIWISGVAWRAGDDRTARGSTYAAYILDKMRQDKMLTVISTGQLPERADQRTVCCTVRAVCGAWSSGASLHPGPQAGPAQPNDCGACDVRQIRRRAPRNEGCRRWHTC